MGEAPQGKGIGIGKGKGKGIEDVTVIDTGNWFFHVLFYLSLIECLSV